MASNSTGNNDTAPTPTSPTGSSPTTEVPPPNTTTDVPPPTTSNEPTQPPTTDTPTDTPTPTTPTPTTSDTPTTTPSPTTSDTSTSSTEKPTTTSSSTDGDGGVSRTTITGTSTASPTLPPSNTSSAPTSTSSTPPGLNDGNGVDGGGSSGLTGAGRTAVAVVVPIVAVALIALFALWYWRRRKQRKDAEELRRKEVEEYGFNPNNDPTLPAIGLVGSGGAADGGPMREEEAGYRGWGSTTGVSSGRKASTTMSGGAAGNAYSEGTSQPPVSDTRSGDPLVGAGGRPYSNEEQLGAMGPSASANRGGDIHRGISNASSSYSVGHESNGSDEQAVPGGAYGAAQYYGSDGPYSDQAYGGRGPAEVQGQPVIRDNLARRATRIENPSHFPTQASAGISQNF